MANNALPNNNVVSAVTMSTISDPAKLSISVQRVTVRDEDYAYSVFASITNDSEPHDEYWLRIPQIGQINDVKTNSWSNWKIEYTLHSKRYQTWTLKVFACNKRVESDNCPPKNMLLLSEKTIIVDPGIPVLMYHMIGTPPEGGNKYLYVSKDNFDSQMRIISSQGFTTLFSSEIDKYKSKDKAVVITFDDGYQNNYMDAYEILKKYGVKATIFIITERIGESGYLTESEIKDMLASGCIEFGSHTKTHTDLRLFLSDETEITDSKSKIEAIFSRRALSIAYPYGYFNERTIDLAIRAGYQYGFTTNPGRYFLSRTEQKSDKLKISRLGIDYNTAINDFLELLSTIDTTA
jgi:peptidoglycan/xylan/chitin deacetylase (PgdA/CDA1 family)